MKSEFFKHIFKLGKNDIVLAKEFDFDEYNRDYIARNFWPTVDIHSYNILEIEDFLQQSKNEFINNNDSFDVDIFKRTEIDLELPYLNRYLECLRKGKYNIWDFRKGKYFYYLKIDSERGTNSRTLLISDKNEVQLEIYFKNILKVLSPLIKGNNQIEIKKNFNEETVNSIKPIFNSKSIIDIFEVLKEHFSNEDGLMLNKLLADNTKPLNKLYFMNNGNMLTDAFKQLIESNLITNCSKSELEKWIYNNFQHRSRIKKKQQDYKSRTIQDVISNKNSKPPCKNPLFTIQNGNIIKV